MALTITKDSHTHNFNKKILDMIVEKYSDKEEFFIDTFTLVGVTLLCGLYGPIMGDEPITSSACHMAPRAGREYPSRIVNGPMRPTDQITVIAGPHEGDPCILYTCFAGPVAPKEPTDPALTDKERAESIKFWSEHALSNESA